MLSDTDERYYVLFIGLYVRLTCFWKRPVRFIFDLATVECRYNAAQYNRYITDNTAVMGAEYKSEIESTKEKTDRVITATHCIVLWQDRRWLTDFTECPHPVWCSVVRMETEVRHIQRQVSTSSVEVHIVSHSRTCSPQVWRCVSRYMSRCPHCCETGIAIVCWSCD